MPFNGTGGFDPLPPPTYPAVAGEVIRASYFNAVIDDIKAGLSQVLVRDGQAPITGNVDLTGNKFTNAANATTPQELTTLAQNDIAYLKRIVAAWLTSSEGKERLYFANNAETYIRGHGSVPVQFINGAGTVIGTFKQDGRLALVADATAPEDVPRYAQVQTLLTQDRTADLKYSLKLADHGSWLLADGRTIGNAASGAVARANADTSALFVALWTACVDAILTIQDSSGVPVGRGASAAADFAANKRLPLPNFNGLVIKGFHNGDGTWTTDTATLLGGYKGDQLLDHLHAFPIGQRSGGDTGLASGSTSGATAIVNTYGANSPSATPENMVRTRAANTFISL